MYIKKIRNCSVCDTPLGGNASKYCSRTCELKGRYKKQKNEPWYRLCVKASRKARKHKLRGLSHTLTAMQYADTLAHFDNKCAYCETPLEAGHHQDHCVPASKGGGYDKNNIVPSCPNCNQRREKGAKDALDWLVSKEHGLVKFVEVSQYLESQ